jgi:hypothetical protein
MVCVVDEKRHVRNLLFLAEFTKDQHGELRRPRLKQPHVEELVRVGMTAANSQWRWPLTRISVSSTVI